MNTNDLAIIVSIVSMLFSCAAMWPQARANIGFFRDVVLWCVFAFLAAGGAAVGWRYLVAYRNPGTAPRPLLQRDLPYDWQANSLQQAPPPATFLHGQRSPTIDAPPNAQYHEVDYGTPPISGAIRLYDSR